ncbi:hypothetical protein D3C72_2144680 [compost metagenome]
MEQFGTVLPFDHLNLGIQRGVAHAQDTGGCRKAAVLGHHDECAYLIKRHGVSLLTIDVCDGRNDAGRT